VIGAYYYLRIVKVMYFDAPSGPAYAKGRANFEGALILLAALIVSPLGYALIDPIATLTNNAAGSLF